MQRPVSVVIAIHEHLAATLNVLRGLARQTLPPHEVIVVDGTQLIEASTIAATLGPALLAALPLRYHRIERPSRAVAWNHGIRQAQTDLILLLGDDFIPEPQLIEEHVRLHEQDDELLVGIGPAFFPPELRREPFMRWLEDSGTLFGVSFTRPNPAQLREFFYGPNTSFSRRLFERVGGFREAFRGHTTDDYELGVRLRALGARLAYLPNARASHEHSVRWTERRSAVRQTGQAIALFEAEHPEFPHPSDQFEAYPAHLARAWGWRLAAWLFGSTHYLERFWQETLKADLVQGFGVERRRLRRRILP